MTVTPKNFKEWLQSAPQEELMQGLYERIEHLTRENATLKQELRNVKMGLATHKHAATTGEATVPIGVVVSPRSGDGSD